MNHSAKWPKSNLEGTGNKAFTGADSPMANLLLSVMGAFAEFERALQGLRIKFC
jgi:DNA invertase Pin-like site-specific DNA recombinase